MGMFDKLKNDVSSAARKGVQSLGREREAFPFVVPLGSVPAGGDPCTQICRSVGVSAC